MDILLKSCEFIHLLYCYLLKFAKMAMVPYFLIEGNLVKKEDLIMDKSQLVAIISRLDAMMKAGGNEPQSRRFEKDGEERGLVTYNPANETFILEEIATKQKFEFDNIDLAALEIFDLLDD